jgi:hypothetical protein
MYITHKIHSLNTDSRGGAIAPSPPKIRLWMLCFRKLKNARESNRAAWFVFVHPHVHVSRVVDDYNIVFNKAFFFLRKMVDGYNNKT